jgi:hypothetical protein
MCVSVCFIRFTDVFFWFGVSDQGDQLPLEPADDDEELNFSDSDLPLSGGDASPAKTQGKKPTLADSGRSLRSSGYIIILLLLKQKK